MRIELASAVERDRLLEKGQSLQREIDRLIGAGAIAEHDPQASLLARLSGQSLQHVRTSLAVMFAVLVEFGAVFGLFLATLPMHGRCWFSNSPVDQSPRACPSDVCQQRPKRFVRSIDGRLMIE